MLDQGSNSELPVIPAKRYFAIGEVSELCGVKPHVLRYWEQEFPNLKPVKRRGNRRYYQRHDVLMIRQIRSLLYDHGFTITGARQLLEGSQATRRSPADPSALRRKHEPPICEGLLQSAPLAISFIPFRRGVAQPGSAPAWGAGGRGFESRRPDHYGILTSPAGQKRQYGHAQPATANPLSCD